MLWVDLIVRWLLWISGFWILCTRIPSIRHMSLCTSIMIVHKQTNASSIQNKNLLLFIISRSFQDQDFLMVAIFRRKGSDNFLTRLDSLHMCPGYLTVDPRYWIRYSGHSSPQEEIRGIKSTLNLPRILSYTGIFLLRSRPSFIHLVVNKNEWPVTGPWQSDRVHVAFYR